MNDRAHPRLTFGKQESRQVGGALQKEASGPRGEDDPIGESGRSCLDASKAQLLRLHPSRVPVWGIGESDSSDRLVFQPLSDDRPSEISDSTDCHSDGTAQLGRDPAADVIVRMSPAPVRFAFALLRRLLRLAPYRLHCRREHASDIILSFDSIPEAMCRAYSLLSGQIAEPLWIEGPLGELEMGYAELDECLRFIYLSESWTPK